MWSYTIRTQEGFTKDVCGQYACLFTFCVDRGLGPHHFVNLFGTVVPTCKWRRLSYGNSGNDDMGTAKVVLKVGIAAPAEKVSVNQS